jgi:hypothetical protein
VSSGAALASSHARVEEAPLATGPAARTIGAKRGHTIPLTDLATQEARLKPWVEANGLAVPTEDFVRRWRERGWRARPAARAEMVKPPPRGLHSPARPFASQPLISLVESLPIDRGRASSGPVRRPQGAVSADLCRDECSPKCTAWKSSTQSHASSCQ